MIAAWYWLAWSGVREDIRGASSERDWTYVSSLEVYVRIMGGLSLGKSGRLTMGVDWGGVGLLGRGSGHSNPIQIG